MVRLKLRQLGSARPAQARCCAHTLFGGPAAGRALGRRRGIWRSRTGPVVFYFHGWPACRLEAGLDPGSASPAARVRPTGLWALHAASGADAAGVGGGRGASSADRLGLQSNSMWWGCRVARRSRRRWRMRCRSGCWAWPSSARCRRRMRSRCRTTGWGTCSGSGGTRVWHSVCCRLARPLLQRRMITPRTVVGKNLPDADRAVLDRATLAGLGRVWREGPGPQRAGGAGRCADLCARRGGSSLEQTYGFRRRSVVGWRGLAHPRRRPGAIPYAIPGVRSHLAPGGRALFAGDPACAGDAGGADGLVRALTRSI